MGSSARYRTQDRGLNFPLARPAGLMLRSILAKLVLSSLCVTIVAGCSDREAPAGPPVLHKRLPTDVSLDLVFVVDNSGSMLAEQQQLTANFPAFIEVLGQLAGGGIPDLHLGVLSSNVGAAGQPSVPGCPGQGDDGNFRRGAPGSTCALQPGDSFIWDIAQPDGSRLKNYTGDLAQVFTCMASLGTSGCGFEMHLESMYRALQPGKNAGFYRDEAYLAVVFLADEDDCSTEVGAMFGDPTATLTSALGPRTSFRCHEFGVVCDNDPTPRSFGPRTGCRPRSDSAYMYEIDRYIDFMHGLKDDPKRVVVAGIIADFDAGSGDLTVGPDPNNATFPSVEKSCHTRDPADPDDGAAPPVRLQAFLRAFPERNAFTTICNENLRDGVVQIAQLLKTAIGSPCIDEPLADRNPDIGGVQPDCTVSEVVGANGPAPTELSIPQCSQTIQAGASCDPGSVPTPCWCIHPDAVQCPPDAHNPQSYAIEVNRGGVSPPLGTVVDVQCAIATP